MRTLAPLLLLLAACGPKVETTTVTEIESVCIDGDEFRVRLRECLSSSCDTLLTATCAATATDGMIEITATATIESQGDECTDDCGEVAARCAVPDVEDPTAVFVQWNGDQGGPALSEVPACGS